ncbi:hypothetical protein CRUP_034685, partial [Coryphaenoides rupestris]
ILVAHFLQSVSSGLVLGGELVYHRGRAEEGGILTLAGQYSRPNWVATLNAGKGGAHASYYHRANKQETTASFGYRMELPEANMVFRGMVNSRCIIGGVLEKRLTPLPATLIMGAFVNHRGDKLQVGLGVNQQTSSLNAWISLSLAWSTVEWANNASSFISSFLWRRQAASSSFFSSSAWPSSAARIRSGSRSPRPPASSTPPPPGSEEEAEAGALREKPK